MLGRQSQLQLNALARGNDALITSSGLGPSPLGLTTGPTARLTTASLMPSLHVWLLIADAEMAFIIRFVFSEKEIAGPAGAVLRVPPPLRPGGGGAYAARAVPSVSKRADSSL